MSFKSRALTGWGVTLALVHATFGLGSGSTANGAEAQLDELVSANPENWTPNVNDGRVNALVQVGNKIIAVGKFTNVTKSGVTYPRNNIFAFDATTGAVDSDFVPNVGTKEVFDVADAGNGNVYIGGAFASVNGVGKTRRVALIDTATGAPVSGFRSPVPNKAVYDLQLQGGRLYIGGPFTAVNGVPRTLLAALNPTTGADTGTVNLAFSGTWNGGTIGVKHFDVSDDGSTLSMKNAPFPTILFSPGFSVDRNAYSSYTTRLATHGFLVITQAYRNAGDHTQDRDDAIKVINWYLNPTGQDAARVAGRVDANRIGAAGHSLGGKISFLVAEADARIKAAFGIDPVNSPPPLGQAPSAITGLPNYKGGTGFLGETLSQGGFMPCAPASDNYQKFYAAANAPSFAITFANAAHNDFVDPGACLLCGLACPGSKGMQAQTVALANKYTVAYFRYQLLGDLGQMSHLTGAEFQKDAMTGAVSVVAK